MKVFAVLGLFGLLHAGTSYAAFADYTRWLDLQDSTVTVLGSSNQVIVGGQKYEQFDLEFDGLPVRNGNNESIEFDYRLSASLSNEVKFTGLSASSMTVYARYSEWDPSFEWEGGYHLRLPGSTETKQALKITNGTCDPEGYICWGWGELPGYEYTWEPSSSKVTTFSALSSVDFSLYANSIIFGPDMGQQNDPLTLGVPKVKLSFLAPVSPVPEPATYALMAGGLAALLLRRRRRR